MANTLKAAPATSLAMAVNFKEMAITFLATATNIKARALTVLARQTNGSAWHEETTKKISWLEGLSGRDAGQLFWGGLRI
jgi:hypothetical protein